MKRAFQVARLARQAPFYAEKYRGLPDPTDLEGWRRLPPLERQEVYVHAYPRSTAMLTRPVEGMIVTSTGGSSGVARYTCYTHAEWGEFVRVQAEALLRMGVRPHDRVANLFLAGHLWPSFLGAHDSISRAGAVHLPISGNLPVEEIARLCQEFDVTVMLSLPTLFLFLADVAARDGYRFPSLRLIGFAGEQMSVQAQEHVRRLLGVRDIVGAGYTSSDCGLMGYACPHTPFGSYHMPGDFQLLELVDPSGAPAREGEVLVTNLARTSMPILRYRVGDVARWTEQPCPCGDPNPVFTLAGRAGDDFKIGGGYISMVVFDETLAAFVPPLSLSYQVELEDLDNQMALRLTVESGDLERAAAVEGELREALLRRVPEFKKGLEMGFLRELSLHFVGLGELPRQPITGKVKRLKDLRVRAAG